MSFVTSLKNPVSGLDNIKALYTSFDIANVLTTVHLPNIVKFLLFQTLRIRSNFSNLLVQFFYSILYSYDQDIFPKT